MTKEKLLEKILAGVHAILGKDGLAVKTVQNFKFSQNQLDYAVKVSKGLVGFNEKTGQAAINIQEAATGTGKSLGNAIPLLLVSTFTGDRVAISTNTKQLQMQLRDKDIPTAVKLVAEYTNTPKRVFSVRIGISNYLSTRACMVHMDRLKNKNPKKFADAIDFLNDVIQWLENEGAYAKVEVSSGKLMDYMDMLSINTLPMGIEASQISLTHKSLKNEMIKYRNDVLASKTADLLICNHALVAQHAYRFNTILDFDGQAFKHIVIDEADQFPSAAEMIIGSDLSLHMLVKHTQDAGFGNGTVTAVQELYDYVATYPDIPPNDLLVMGDDSTFGKLLETAHDKLKAPYTKADHALMLKGGLTSEVEINYAAFCEAYEDLDKTYKAYNDPMNKVVLNWSPIKKFPSVRISKHNIGDIIKRLYSHTKKQSEAQSFDAEGNALIPTYVESILFTSATLSNPDKSGPDTFDNFSKKVGINRYCLKGTTTKVHNTLTDLWSITQPMRNFGKMSIFLADARVTEPTKKELDEDGELECTTEPEFLEYVSKGIRKAFSMGGDCLVLTQSWRDNQSLSALLSDLPKDKFVLHQSGEPLASVKNRYLATEGGLMLTPSGWEGLDMPSRVKNLIITRIPFAPLDKAKDELAKSVWLHRGGTLAHYEANKWTDFAYAAMIKMIQGIGRGIRSAEDEVNLWILDPRFPRPEHMANELDPDLVLAVTNTKTKYDKFIKCIPKRFRTTEYEAAKVLLKDGSIYVAKEYA